MSTPVAPGSRFVAVGGLRLHYLDWGNDGAPPVLLLHNLAESADAWRPVAAALAGEFHVVAPDLRGHGDSDWIDTYSPQEEGDDIGEMISVLGLSPAAVVGMGMGARAAALLAARQEHLVSAIVMIGAGVHMYHPAEREAAEAVLTMPRIHESPAAYVAWWQRLRASLGLRPAAAPPHDADSLTAAERMLRRLPDGGWSPKFDVDGHQRYRESSPGARTVDYHDEFHEITCPVLLVRGADSTVMTAEELAETLTVIEHARAVEIPAARHDVPADNPAALLDALLPFLREIET